MRPERLLDILPGKRRALAVLLPIFMLVMLGACNSSSPTDPGGDDDDNNPPAETDIVFSGDGSTLLPGTDFPVDASFIDEVGNYFWVDQNAGRAAGDVKIQVFPNPVDPAGVTSASLFFESATQPGAWTTWAIGSLAGVTVADGKVTFTDVVVSDDIFHQGDVTINGTLDVPTTVLTAPDAPTAVTVTPQDGNLEVSWTAVADADAYNVYVARDASITPANYAGLSEGAMHPDATSPFTFPGGLTNGLTYYVIVTGVNAAGEGAASDAVSGAPVGEAPDAGGLTLSGDGAALLPSTDFAPDTCLPGDLSINDGSFLWLDHANTQGQLQVWMTNAVPTTVSHARFVSGDRYWDTTEWTGLSGIAVNGDAVTLTALSLDEDGGGSTLVLDGTVNSVLTIGTPPSGTLTFSGEGAAALPSTSFTPTGLDFAGGQIQLSDDNGVTLEVKLNSFGHGLYRLTVAQGANFFIKQTGSDPIDGVTSTGLGFGCTNVVLSPVWGSGDLILDGTLGF